MRGRSTPLTPIPGRWEAVADPSTHGPELALGSQPTWTAEDRKHVPNDLHRPCTSTNGGISWPRRESWPRSAVRGVSSPGFGCPPDPGGFSAKPWVLSGQKGARTSRGHRSCAMTMVCHQQSELFDDRLVERVRQGSGAA